MPDITTFWERIGGRSPSLVGFSRRGGGRGVMKWGIGDSGDGQNPLTAGTQIHDAIKEMMGFTVPHEDGLRLKRTLPKAHPLCPWMFVDSIGEIVGEGRMTKVPTDPSLEAPSFDNAAFYPTQEVSLEFKPVMHNVWADSSIPTGTITWTDDDKTVYSGVGYAKEWLRYTDFEELPAGEYIVAQSGQFLFNVASGAAPDGLSAGNGQLRMWIPQRTLKVTWSEVPYEYIDYVSTAGVRTDSYIGWGLGRINYNDWYGYDKGTLALRGLGISRYPQIIPDYAYGNESTAFTSKKLCDITFLMQILDPGIGNDAAGALATPDAPTNLNVIQNGWNLQPFAHGSGWYFAETVVPGFADASGRGIYPAFPYELLFTNPGVPPG